MEDKTAMTVFISWSGPKSKAAASALRSWLQDVIQSVKPWMSDADIGPGERWSQELQQELSEARYGIITVTKANVRAPWLLFEAGSLAKALKGTFVCPYLVDLQPIDLPDSPLRQFQAVKADEEGTWRLLESINGALPQGQLTSDQLQRYYTHWWPELEAKIKSLPEDDGSLTSPASQHFPYSLFLVFPKDLPEAAHTLIDWDDDRCFLLGPDFQENIRLVPSRVGPSLRVEMSEAVLKRLRPGASYKLALTDGKGNRWRVRRFFPFEADLPLEPQVPLSQILRDLRGDGDEE
jgi:hypothetical protein